MKLKTENYFVFGVIITILIISALFLKTQIPYLKNINSQDDINTAPQPTPATTTSTTPSSIPTTSTSIPVAPPPTQFPYVPPPCAPLVSPITTSISICASTTVNAPIIIAASNIQVICQPGVTLTRPGGAIAPFDLFTFATGVTGSALSGCNIQNGFNNAIRLSIGTTGNIIIGNTINGALVGIKDDLGAYGNIFTNNVITNSRLQGMLLQGRNGRISGSSIIANPMGIQLGYAPSGNPNTFPPGALCSSGANGDPVICSRSYDGADYVIYSSNLKNNRGAGVVNYGLDNQFLSNTFNNNVIGIDNYAIFAGSETNPYSNRLQEYFQSGVKILGNTLMNNQFAGVYLNGKSNYYDQVSQQFARTTLVSGNTFSANKDGIVLGRKDINYYTGL